MTTEPDQSPSTEQADPLAERRDVQWMRSPHAQLILGVISFTESMFAPIITDPFLVAIILADRLRWIRYTVITSITSVLGGVAAYYLGAFFFEVAGSWIISVLQMEAMFTQATEQILVSGFLFVFIGAITPIPYTLVALASGFASVPILVFVLASLVGRSIRYAIVGYLSYAFGPLALRMFRHQIHLITALALAFTAVYVVWKIWG